MKLFYGFPLYLNFYELIIFTLIFHHIICPSPSKSEEFEKIYSKLKYLSDDSDFIYNIRQIYIYNSQISNILNTYYKDNKKKFIHFDLNSIYILINETYYEKWFHFENESIIFNYYDLTAFVKENNTINFIISFIHDNKLNFNHYQKRLTDNANISNYYEYNNESISLGQGISCHMLENENTILICFYSKIKKIEMLASCFRVEHNFTLYGKISNITNPVDEYDAQDFIKSSIIKNQNKFFVCLAINNVFCVIYDNNKNNFEEWLDKQQLKGKHRDIIQTYYFEDSQNVIFFINSGEYKTEVFSINNQGELKANGDCQHQKNNNGFLYYFLSYNKTSNTYHLITEDDIIYNCTINSSIIPNFINSEEKTTKAEYVPTTIKEEFSQITNQSTIIGEIVSDSTDLKSFYSSETIFVTSNINSDTFINTISTTSIKITNNLSIDSQYIDEPSTNTNNINSISNNIINIFTNNLSTEESSTNIHLSYSPPISPTTINNIIKLDNVNFTKENLFDEIQSIVNKIEIGKTYEKIEDDFSLYIYPTNSTFLTSVTHVNFSECESILRKHYKMPDTSIMTFFQVELKNDDSNSLINQVEYQAYYNNTFLNLSLCNNTNIKVYYSIKDNSFIDFSSVASFQDSGIDIFNINDSFFNDICHPYSNGEDDLILKDRIKDIYLNYSLCEQGCTYNEVDLDYMTISCDCQVKDNISTVVSPLNLDQIIETPSNFEVIKCYNLVFSWDGKLKNFGFWIFLILILAQGPLLLHYFNKGIKSIRTYVLNEMIEYGYIKDNKNKKIKVAKKSRKKGKKLGKSINKENKSLSTKKTTKSAKFAPPKNKKNKAAIKGKNKRTINKIQNKKEDKSSSINNLKSTPNNEIVREINSEKKIKKNKIMKYSHTKKISNKIKNKAHLQTQAFDESSNEKTNENKKNINKYFLININLNLSRDEKYVPPESHIILNNYTFQQAVKYDLRQVCVIFYIFILSKQIVFHTFLYKSSIELFSLRLYLFLFIFSSDLALNAFFYFDNNISKKYKANKNLFLFTFSDNIFIIFITTLCVFILLTLIAKLSNSIYDIREVFMKEEEKLIKDKKYKVTAKRKKEILLEIDTILHKYKIKITILIIIEIIIMMLFWYYVTAFCHVYSSTQISWILDSLLSMLSRAIIEMLISFLLAKLYRLAVESENHCIYRFVMFLYNFS